MSFETELTKLLFQAARAEKRGDATAALFYCVSLAILHEKWYEVYRLRKLFIEYMAGLDTRDVYQRIFYEFQSLYWTSVLGSEDQLMGRGYSFSQDEVLVQLRLILVSTLSPNRRLLTRIPAVLSSIPEALKVRERTIIAYGLAMTGEMLPLAHLMIWVAVENWMLRYICHKTEEEQYAQVLKLCRDMEKPQPNSTFEQHLHGLLRLVVNLFGLGSEEFRQVLVACRRLNDGKGQEAMASLKTLIGLLTEEEEGESTESNN